MAAIDEERRLWRQGEHECVLRSCCSGAELQIRRVDDGGGSEILLRELYPTKSDLYERARQLEDEYRDQSPTTRPSRSSITREP